VEQLNIFLITLYTEFKNQVYLKLLSGT
jgi:hypothetical protein